MLFFLFGACLPLFVVGPELSEGLWASPSIFVGMAIVTHSIFSGKVTLRLLLLALMIVVFALTSMGRHSPETYIPSLLMLFSVASPICLSRIGREQQKALGIGFIWGLYATLLLVWVQITTQVTGQQALYETVVNLFRPLEFMAKDHNFFMFYFRPSGAFMEPAHLAIYLVMALFVLDLIGNRKSERLRFLTVLTLFFVGSIVGYVLFIGYLAIRYVPSLRRGFKRLDKKVFEKKAVTATFAVILFVLPAIALFDGSTALDHLVERLLRTVEAVQLGNLSGSEGSRANTIRVLFDYWKLEGLYGFMFGTGYGNSSDWLIQNFRNLDSWATVSRGSVDSIIVAILISTGFFGGVFYLFFAALCLSRVGRDSFLRFFMFFLLLNMATGFLIAYPIWHLFAVILLLSPSQKLNSLRASVQPEATCIHSTWVGKGWSKT